eukprot:6007908-Amphidinium_carterae.1
MGKVHALATSTFALRHAADGPGLTGVCAIAFATQRAVTGIIQHLRFHKPGRSQPASDSGGTVNTNALWMVDVVTCAVNHKPLLCISTFCAYLQTDPNIQMFASS